MPSALPDLIIPRLMGRLGNNMFQIAQAFTVACEYNRQMVIYKPDLDYENNQYGDTIFRAFQFTDVLPENAKWGLSWPYEDQPTEYKEYYQGSKYFEQYSEMIKTMFGPPLDFTRKILKEYPWLGEERVTAISIRRGDYLNYPNIHPVVSEEYIYEAMKGLPTNQRILVFSDDLPWCRENLKFDFEIIDTGYFDTNLWVMSMCDDFLISNSTYSWWGAYLSRQTNKTVIAPYAWFANREPDTWQDIYCEGWVVHPSKFLNGKILPL